MVKNAPGTLVLPWQIFHSGVIRKVSTEALCVGLIRITRSSVKAPGTWLVDERLEERE